MSIEHRLARVRAALDEWGVEGVLISNPMNRRWLSGFTGSAGWLLILPDAAWLATDFRYWEQAAHQAPAYAIHQMGERRVIAETVRDVAADWNFWHFSQFASDYRKLFGYSPSATPRTGLH